MTSKFALALTFALTLAPAFASAEAKPPTVHMRPQLFHDRTPHVHSHNVQPHKPA